MSTTLAPGVAPAALVPGDPAGPRALATRLDAYASTLEEAQQRAGLALARVETAEADTAAWRSRLAAHHAALATEAGGGPPAGPAPSAWNGPPPTRPTSPGSGPRPGTPPGSSSPGRPRPPWSWASWSSSSTPPTP
ncbi:MAG: hypothetical protein KY450_13995 [Actinobacteria bacterium]|nr:hypothetical protein [Actinomycetota bacterium]